MARVALQVKNIAAMVLATGGSLAWSFASRRFDAVGKSWIPAAIVGTLCLGCQLALLFVESKEEQELSLFRQHQMIPVREMLEVSSKIVEEIKAGNVESAQKLIAIRRDQYGK